MSTAFLDHLNAELTGLRDAGLFKAERILTTPQAALVRTADGREEVLVSGRRTRALA